MDARLRALADRFIYDTATLQHALTLLDDAALGLRSEATGWTVRATFGHLCEAQEAYAAASARLAEGTAPPAEFEGHDRDAHRSALPARHAATPAEELHARLAAGRADVVAALDRVPPNGNEPERDGGAAGWAGHARGHGLDLLEAVEALRVDAVVVTWALGQPFDDPDLEKRRKALGPVVRKALQAARKRRKKGED
jgi:hypothetical protein